MIIKVKQNMNSQEIREWKAGKSFISLKGEYKYKNWKLNIYVDCFENIDNVSGDITAFVSENLN